MAALVNPRELINTYAINNKDITQLQFIRDDPEEVTIADLPSGYVNFTFRVTSRDRKSSVIIKHFRTYCKMFPDIPMPIIRMRVEYEALKMFNCLSSGSCPMPYHIDTNLNIVAMEDLSWMTLLWELLQTWRVDVRGMTMLASVLARFHDQTSRINMTEERWQDLTTLYRQDYTAGIRDYFFVTSLDAGDKTVELEGEMREVFDTIISDQTVMEAFSKLRQVVDEEQCLVHGDCSERAVFIAQQRCAVFDMEYVSPGHKVLDLAHPLCSLVILYHITPPGEEGQHHRDNIKLAVEGFLDTYCREQPSVCGEEDRAEVMSLVAGVVAVYTFRTANFAGFDKMFTMGASYKQRALILQRCAQVLKGYKNIKDISALISALFGK